MGDFNLGNITSSSDTGCPLGCKGMKTKLLLEFFQSNSIPQLNCALNQNDRLLDFVITDGPDAITVTPDEPVSRLDVHPPPPFEM